MLANIFLKLSHTIYFICGAIVLIFIKYLQYMLYGDCVINTRVLYIILLSVRLGVKHTKPNLGFFCLSPIIYSNCTQYSANGMWTLYIYGIPGIYGKVPAISKKISSWKHIITCFFEVEYFLPIMQR